jgi:DnaK suppressor protein
MAEVKKQTQDAPIPTGFYPEFYRLLIARIDEIIPRELSARANRDEQVMASPGDEADLSVLDESADYFSHLANAHQRTIVEIREALGRMNRGVYGVCESCELPVSVDRLKKIPEARFCIDCQSRMERLRMAYVAGGKRTTQL